MEGLFKTKLLAVQEAIKPIKKDSENPFFKSMYFDINSILAEIKPILNSHNILLTQKLTTLEGGKMGLKTTLYDTGSDEVLESECPLPENPDPQKMGSIITYFRRYALQSLLALEAEDDDANQATGQKAPELMKKNTNNFKI